MVFVKEEPNEHGTGTSHHICDECGVDFTITPSAKGKEGYDCCTADGCPSYDPDRDLDIMWMTDEEIARDKPLVSMELLRQRKSGEFFERLERNRIE